MSQGIKHTENDFTIAHNGIIGQAIAHGLDPNEPKLAAFITHQAKVLAQEHAIQRHIQNALHKHTLNPEG